MAQAEHLPTSKWSYDLRLHLEQVLRSSSRYHTYTLGADLGDGARRVLELIMRANARRDKAPLLVGARYLPNPGPRHRPGWQTVTRGA